MQERIIAQGMKQHYDRIAQKMLLDLEDSKTADHKGEQGRNNEQILRAFLVKYLEIIDTKDNDPTVLRPPRHWLYYQK